jgi:hypothetical protein
VARFAIELQPQPFRRSVSRKTSSDLLSPYDFAAKNQQRLQSLHPHPHGGARASRLLLG